MLDCCSQRAFINTNWGKNLEVDGRRNTIKIKTMNT